MAYIPASNSVVAFQSDPTKLQVTASVAGTVNIGTTPGSVVAFQGTSPWAVTSAGSVATVIIGGSIAASFTPPANQSVSGTVGASAIGLTPVAVTNIPSISGTVQIGNLPTNQNVSGSVVAFQGTSPWVVNFQNSSIISIPTGSVITVHQGSVATVIIGGSISATFTPPANQSVSGTVNIGTGGPVSVTGTMSVLGTVPVTLSGAWSSSVVGSVSAFLQSSGASVITVVQGSIAVSVTPPANQSVSGAVSVSNFPTTQNVSGSVVAFVSGTVPVNTAGSVVAFQGTSPWVVNFQNSSIFAVQAGTRSTSIVSSTPSSVLVGTSIFGQLPAGTAVLGSVATLQGTNPWIITGSVQGAFSPSGNQSVSGTVATTQAGTWISSIVSTVPSSVIVGASIFGQLPAGTAPLGSVAVLQGTLPWAVAGSVVAFVSGTVAVNTAGSVVSFQGTSPWVIQSIVGTYSEDQASTSADKGLLAFGVRNDTVASLVGSDSDYGAWSQDSAGRHLVKPFVSEDGTIISYVGSVVSGSVTLIQASVTGKKSYITDFMISNTGAATTLVTFQGGDTSLVGQYIAPTGGGYVVTGLNLPLKTNASQDLVFKTSVMTSILYLTVKGYVAP